MAWNLVYTKQELKDAKKLNASGLKPKTKALLYLIQAAPFISPSRYEKLVGDLNGTYSRRINIQHRIVYQVIEQDKVIKIIRLWSHYE
ncbi:Txe/YoeB family addiction module toxin [Thiomicrorhabdus sp.]|uniref:Txe/YoeB family addiction module toxin n=1 Tax=Thiomicrorhabdus sp. TaxID=2039724 RepID=UPI002AA7E2E3|nr:Txe/YoeB family addiction module toxin [Thiomicrorhabdus sp.]